VIMLLIVGLDIYLTKELASVAQNIYEHPLKVSNAVRDIKIHINAMHRSMKDLVIAETPEQLNDAVEKINANERASLGHFDMVEKRYLGDKKHVISARRDFEDWKTLSNEVIELVKQGRRKEATTITKGKGVEHITLINEGVDGKAGLNYLINFADAKAVEFRKIVEQKEKRGVLQTLIILCMTILLILVFLIMFYRFLKSSADLADSEERLNLVLEGADVISWDWNVQTGEVSYDIRWAKMLGYSQKEIIPNISSWENLIHPNDKPYVDKILKATLEGITPFYEADFRLKKKSGEWMWILSRGKVVKRDSDGKPLRMTGTHLDITERKQAEEELKQKDYYLERAQELSKIGTWELDLEINRLVWTDENCRIFGVPVGTVVNYEIFLEKVHPDDRKYVDREWKAALEEKPYDIEHRVLLDGQTKWVREKADVAFDKFGKAVKAIGFTQDITERKEIEQQLLQSEKLKSLGELAGGVAHNFNNLLAVILGNAQLLKMVIEPPPGEEERRKSVSELKRGLEIIENASRDGTEVVRRINAFTRGKEDRNFATVNINEIIDHTLEFTKTKWKNEAEYKGIKINIQKELSPVLHIEGSSSELREVFTNIIKNALDAMPQGGQITFKTFKEGGYVCIKVDDTGVGIADDRKARIFDPFFTTKGVTFSGLGLSVSYGIINSHRGTITVDSIEGQETTFTIKLPISDKRPDKIDEEVKLIIGEQRKARILVIEDEEQVLNLLSGILITGGHEVETATNGNQGIEILEKKEFDLVFTDLGMPGMTGWQVAEKTKNINKKIPVALITGWNVELKQSEMKESSVDLIVYKPFEVEQVLNLVQKGMILKDKLKEA